MNLKLLFVFLFGSIMTLSAQNQGTISGKVIDNKTKEALPYVNIIVKENGTMVTGERDHYSQEQRYRARNMDITDHLISNQIKYI